MKDVRSIEHIHCIIGLLKACAEHKDLYKGCNLHAYIQEHKFLQENAHVAGTLVSMYARCGAFAKAQQVLNELPVRNVVMWNALIAGYAQLGQAEEALKCFDSMQREGHCPDSVTCICALKACGSVRAAARGEKIHGWIVSLGMLEKHTALGSSLVDMYARSGALTRAQHVLDELPVRDMITWTALIAGYTQQGQPQEALKCFDSMQLEGHSPNAITFICALKACKSIGAVAEGERIHNKIVCLGMLEANIVLGGTLVDMYAKCGALTKAQEVFNGLPVRDRVMWTTLVAGYVEQGQPEEALRCFEGMRHEGHTPDLVTFICALKACRSLRAATKGEEIHETVASLGLLEKSVVLGSTLVDMYARCGALAKAQQVLDKLPICNVVTWNGLIGGYVQHGHAELALKCFERMEHEGHCPDVITFVSVLQACGSIGSTMKGERIHDKIVSLGLLEDDIVLGGTLVDMYAKCDSQARAEGVLKKLAVQNVITWNALIGGYAQQGQSGEALQCLDRMLFKGVRPDSTTLMCVLNACSHAGVLDHAKMCFLTMNIKYHVTQAVEHYSCMVDILGRVGEFNIALSLIEKMPYTDYLPVWHSLLGAAHKWGDAATGRIAFEYALYLHKKEASVYICMANIYTAAGMQEDADKIEVMRVANEA